MSDYKKIETDVIAGLTEVRLYEETLNHIRENHPEVPILLPIIQEALANAIIRPSYVEASYGGSYEFVDQESTNSSGDPLRVPVKPVGDNSGRIRTAYFASTANPGQVIWRRDDE